jgi:hypothetical protein
MQILIPAALALLSFHVAGQSTKQVPSLPKSVERVVANRSDALKGLKGVHVFVDIDDNATEAGLDKVALTTRVELTLRRNGIRVYTEEEMFLAVGMPSLSITPNISGSMGSVSVKCEQNVKSVVIPGVTIIGAIIWERSSIGGSLRAQEGIDSLVESFCNDFLKANPK